jgi:putative hydrolase of the HAD superfamily
MAEVQLLAEVPEVIPVIAGWYQVAWKDWFADISLEEIESDFRNIANQDKLPLGLIARDKADRPIGVCSLRDDPFGPYPHAGPWLRGLYVHAPWRGQGVAGELIRAAEQHAARLGVARLYAATGTAIGTFERAGWLGFDEVRHEQQILTIFARRMD